MRIEPTGVTPPGAKPVDTARGAAAKSSDASPTAGAGESFTLSSDLASLLAAARQAPDVRADAVSAASAQLAAGALDTPAAAADTARALLDSGDATP